MDKIGTAIIGGGVVGLATAVGIASLGEEVFLFEKNPYLGDEQSGRNSGVIHAGLYYEKFPLKRKLCVEGNRMMYEFCEKSGVPCARTGKLIVATNAEEDAMIERYLKNAREAGVEGVVRVSPQEVRRREPNIRAYSALWSPSTGLVDAATYTQALAHLATSAGTEILKETKVTDVKPVSGGFELSFTNPDGSSDVILAEKLINSAGLYSDEIARMINPENPWEITPVRGEYYYFNCKSRDELQLNGTNIYPVQKPYYIDGVEYLAIGVHLTPVFEMGAGGKKSVGGRTLIGPTSTPVERKDDLDEGRNPAEYFMKEVNGFFPGLKLGDISIDYAGNRAKLKGEGDFVIERDSKYPAAINLVGIESPGLTASLAIAEFVKNIFIG